MLALYRSVLKSDRRIAPQISNASTSLMPAVFPASCCGVREIKRLRS